MSLSCNLEKFGPHPWQLVFGSLFFFWIRGKTAFIWFTGKHHKLICFTLNVFIKDWGQDHSIPLHFKTGRKMPSDSFSKIEILPFNLATRDDFMGYINFRIKSCWILLIFIVFVWRIGKFEDLVRWKYWKRCFWIAGLSLMLFMSALGGRFLESCEYVCKCMFCSSEHH